MEKINFRVASGKHKAKNMAGKNLLLDLRNI